MNSRKTTMIDHRALAILIFLSIVGCKKNSPTVPASIKIPKGTSIKYEAICSSTGDKLGLSYYDAQGDRIGDDNGVSGWSYSFTTIKDNTIVVLGIVDLTNNPGQVTGRIYVNGTVVKEGLGGSSLTLNYYP